MNAPLTIHGTTACFQGLKTMEALERLAAGVYEPAFDAPLSMRHVQICPQSTDILSDALIDEVLARYPDTQFRLHGPARVILERPMTKLRWSAASKGFYEALARVSQRLGATGYTFHAYMRPEETRETITRAVHELTDLFGHPAGVEAMYPGDRQGERALASWDDYRWLLSSGLYFALDLSHAHIMAHATGRRDEVLLTDMVASPNCLEVHLAGNDGRSDRHQILQERPWWWRCLVEGVRQRPDALIFSEGNQSPRRTVGAAA